MGMLAAMDDEMEDMSWSKWWKRTRLSLYITVLSVIMLAVIIVITMLAHHAVDELAAFTIFKKIHQAYSSSSSSTSRHLEYIGIFLTPLLACMLRSCTTFLVDPIVSLAPSMTARRKISVILHVSSRVVITLIQVTAVYYLLNHRSLQHANVFTHAYLPINNNVLYAEIASPHADSSSSSPSSLLALLSHRYWSNVFYHTTLPNDLDTLPFQCRYDQAVVYAWTNVFTQVFIVDTLFVYLSSSITSSSAWTWLFHRHRGGGGGSRKSPFELGAELGHLSSVFALSVITCILSPMFIIIMPLVYYVEGWACEYRLIRHTQRPMYQWRAASASLASVIALSITFLLVVVPFYFRFILSEPWTQDAQNNCGPYASFRRVWVPMSNQLSDTPLISFVYNTTLTTPYIPWILIILLLLSLNMRMNTQRARVIGDRLAERTFNDRIASLSAQVLTQTKLLSKFRGVR